MQDPQSSEPSGTEGSFSSGADDDAGGGERDHTSCTGPEPRFGTRFPPIVQLPGVPHIHPSCLSRAQHPSFSSNTSPSSFHSASL